MKFLTKLLRKREFESDRQTIEALKTFTQQFYLGETLTTKQAQRNLERGIVELTWDEGSHAANGLLLTENGYFVTCLHCVEEPKKMRVRGDYFERCRIEKVLVESKKHDLALAKADITGNCAALSYKFHKEEIGERGEIIAVFGRREGEIYRRHGNLRGRLKSEAIKIESENYYLGSHINYDLVSQNGDSGGIIADLERRILGVLALGSRFSKTEFDTSAVKWYKVLEMICYYRSHLERKWL